MEAFRHEATDEKASTRRMSAQLMQLRADFDQLDANYRRNDEDISQKIYQWFLTNIKDSEGFFEFSLESDNLQVLCTLIFRAEKY